MSLQNDERKIREYSNKDRANYYYEKSAYLGALSCPIQNGT